MVQPSSSICLFESSIISSLISTLSRINNTAATIKPIPLPFSDINADLRRVAADDCVSTSCAFATITTVQRLAARMCDVKVNAAANGFDFGCISFAAVIGTALNVSVCALHSNGACVRALCLCSRAIFNNNVAEHYYLLLFSFLYGIFPFYFSGTRLGQKYAQKECEVSCSCLLLSRSKLHWWHVHRWRQ